MARPAGAVVGPRSPGGCSSTRMSGAALYRPLSDGNKQGYELAAMTMVAGAEIVDRALEG